MKSFNKNKFNEHIRKLKSLRLVLILLITVLAMIPVAVCGGLLVSNYETAAVDEMIIEVSNQCNILSKDISRYSYLNDQNNSQVSAEINQLANTYSARILVIGSNFKILTDTYVYEENKNIISDEVIGAFKGNTTTNYNKSSGYVEITVPIYSSDSQSVNGVLIISFSDSRIMKLSDTLNDKREIISIVSLFIIMGCAFIVSGLIIRPLRKLNKAVTGISLGDYENRLKTNGLYETGQISASVNSLLDKVKTLDESRQEFVSNVSHELKTPITSIKVLADSLNSQEEVPNEIYKEFMQDIVEEIDREDKIINDLLSLVRMDRTAAVLNISIVDINELVELILKRLRPIAVKKNIELVLESFRPVVAEVDEVKITLAITNLVENAIKYNIPNGWVHVSINADHRYFYIKVSDSGIGIPAECKEHIFERFYRVDKARSRETGGTGLGLAITKNAVIMHRGVMKVYSKENEGTTFTVRIPLYYSKNV